MIRKTTIILALILIANFADAQITNIHNFYSQNLFYYSPAHTGDKEQLAAFAVYRRNLALISNATETVSVGVHSPITKKMNLGGLIRTQKVGLFKTVSGRLDYAFRTKITDNQKIAFGINIGMLQRGINADGAIVEDPTDQVLRDNGYLQKNIFFSGASVAYSYKNFEIDLGIPTMYQTQTVSKVFYANYWSYMAYSFMGGENFKIKPSLALTYNSAKFLTYQANILVNYNNLIWIQPTYKANGSMAFSAGVNVKKLGIAYSYETNSSVLKTFGGASHELMLTYGFFRTKPQVDTTSEYYHKLVQNIEGKTYEEYVRTHNHRFYNNIVGLSDSIHQEEVKKIAELKNDSIQKNKLALLEKQRLDSINQARLAAIAKAKQDSARAYNLRHLNQEELKILEKGVHFQLGSALLDKTNKFYLNKVAILLINNKKINLLVAGHTCDIGTEQANLRVSKKRANAVVYYLKQRGVSAKQISADYKLDAEPIVPNINEANRKLNRRVSFSVIKD